MSREGKPRGHLVHERTHQYELRRMLMAHYQSNRGFMTALAGFLAHHPKLLKTERFIAEENFLNEWHYFQTQQIMERARASGDERTFNKAAEWATAISTRQERLGKTIRRQKAPLARYLKELGELAFEWGLRADWAARFLHNAVVFFLVGSDHTLHLYDFSHLTIRGDEIPPHRIVVDVTYDPTFPPAPAVNDLARAIRQYEMVADPHSQMGTTIRVWYGEWDDVERAIVNEARRQRDAFRAQEAQRIDVSIRDTKPALERHVYWLYLRICPQEDFGRPYGWATIAQRERVAVKTVKKSVLALARQLGLTLPRLPPGRRSR